MRVFFTFVFENFFVRKKIPTTYKRRNIIINYTLLDWEKRVDRGEC